MHLTTTLPLWLTLTSTLVTPATAIDATLNATLVASAKLAATRLDRAALFTAPNSTVFDFTSHPYHTFAPGGVVNANAATFPYVTGNGMTLAMLYLGPCAMLPAHLHPRAANYVVSVKGTTETYMVEENGAATVRATLGEGMMTIFPRGSVHMMENAGMCVWFPSLVPSSLSCWVDACVRVVVWPPRAREATCMRADGRAVMTCAASLPLPCLGLFGLVAQTDGQAGYAYPFLPVPLAQNGLSLLRHVTSHPTH
ncbi:RmlC-like cupin domain-containing protein [Phyllosticta citribraziliensis]|uniref:RmlC-like cupin domain-containing protein n=1 Tax=Phyllosticta citribraziliensis TaxID=989973 RepID=A0ABR1LCA1_9PEZI